MRANRTINRPMFEGISHSRQQWTWTVTMKIGSSGYCREMHVIASTGEGDTLCQGTAYGDVPPFCDVHRAMEVLATEAMLAAGEPTLWDRYPSHEIDLDRAML